MLTPAVRARVSAVSFAALVMAGACARGPAPETWSQTSAGQSLPIRFDNTAQTYVDVYFVTPQRQWRLGRVAPGARATLRIPEEAITATSGFARLAVLAGAPMTLDVSRDPHATFTIAQPASELVAQRWTFSQKQLESPELLGAPSKFRAPLSEIDRELQHDRIPGQAGRFTASRGQKDRDTRS